ncbi:hypothetical protein GF402_02550 [Candidatus Fermentibacteria bacterium]|nr:hypothetical protein [Candidatus Fermentibacteria bacterium]
MLKGPARIVLVTLLFFPLSCGGRGQGSDALEEARLLHRAGRYGQSLVMYESILEEGPYDPQLQLEYARTAVLAAQSERSRSFRQRALQALRKLGEEPGDADSSEVGELWRRLGWEMARDHDSLQAYRAFGMSAEHLGMADPSLEEEWLLRGLYAGRHLAQVGGVPDSVRETQVGDSLLAAAAERHLVELDRVPLTRTDLRPSVLIARALLLPYTDRRREELEVLTELDRHGEIDPGWRHRRMQLMLELAREDIEEGRSGLAREKLLEIWSSSFVGEQVEAAVLLGELAEQDNDPEGALRWYRNACSISPDLSTPAARLAAARRDSLLYLMP